MSRGCTVRRSITSQSMPSPASSSAAASASLAMRDQATSVTSWPCRVTRAAPSGISYSSSGTGPFAPSRRLCRTTTTGLSSRSAATSRPFMSPALAGITVLSPGRGHSRASRLWLCWAPAESPAPPMVVMVSGRVALPPNMYLSLAAWLAIWSMDTSTKSMNIRSTTGRSPTTAAPMPRPMIACSEIGVSTMRRSPKSSTRPSKLWNTPPVRPTSSPATKTSGILLHHLAEPLVEGLRR